MRNRVQKRGWLRRWLVLTLLMAVSFGTVILTIHVSGRALPLPGDCWGELLSDEPVPCYALEEAQRAGLVEVEAIFLLDGAEGDILNIYLSHADEDHGRLIDVLVEKGREFMERWPDRVPPRPYWSRYCDGLDCVLQMTFEQILGVKGERGKIKGWAGNYNRIQVFTGGGGRSQVFGRRLGVVSSGLARRGKWSRIGGQRRTRFSREVRCFRR